MPKIQAVFSSTERTIENIAALDTSIDGELNLISGLANAAYGVPDESKLRVIRQIGAVAVRCQVNHGIVEKPS